MVKNNNVWWLVLLLVGLAVLVGSQFSVFDVERNKLAIFSVGPVSGSSVVSDTAVFDDWGVSITAVAEVTDFSGCDVINYRFPEDVEVVGVDSWGCDLFRYHKKNVRCETGGHCGDRCDSKTLYSYSKKGDYCAGDGSNFNDGFCRRYCDLGRVVVGSEWFFEGGAEFNDGVGGCFWYWDLEYKGVVVREFRFSNEWEPSEFGQGIDRLFLSRDGVVSDVLTDDSFYSLVVGSNSYDSGRISGNERCLSVSGGVGVILDEDDFVWSVVYPESAVFVGDVAEVTVVLSQDVADFTGVLSVEYVVDTAIGSVSKVEVMDVVVSRGINEYVFSLPTTDFVSSLEVTPSLELHYDTSGWTHDGSVSVRTVVGSIKGDTVVASVRPVAERDLDNLRLELLSVEEQLVLLRGSIDRKVALLQSLTSELELQGALISELNQSVVDNALLVQAMTSEIDEQAVLINELNQTVGDNALIIAAMDLRIAEQVELIEKLSRSQDEKDAYIALLLDEIVGQQGKIVELNGVVELNAEIISKMNATVQEQLLVIDALELNVEEKAVLIVELMNELAGQQGKIVLLQALADELGEDYAQAKDLILQLRSELDEADMRVEFMIVTVDELSLSNAEVIDLLNSYEAELVEDAGLIESLRLSNAELAGLLVEYESNLNTAQDLINELELSNEQLRSVLALYEAEIVKQQGLTAELNVSNAELNALIAEYLVNLITEQELVDALGVSNAELQVLVDEYIARLELMGGYVSELELSNEELQVLVDSLNAEIEYQKALIDEINAAKKKSVLSPSMILVGALCAVVVILVWFALKMKRKGHKKKGKRR